jgi:hypothetical protein
LVHVGSPQGAVFDLLMSSLFKALVRSSGALVPFHIAPQTLSN